MARAWVSTPIVDVLHSAAQDRGPPPQGHCCTPLANSGSILLPLAVA